jgi:SAM-dependent methyltransferase
MTEIQQTFPTQCEYCSGALEIVWSYKHLWFACEDCGNVSRHLRSRLPLDSLTFLKGFLPVNSLWHQDHVQKDVSKSYEYYNAAAKAGPAGTKWEGQLQDLENDFGSVGCAIEGPVLDISGGPGFLVKALKTRGFDATVTELAEGAAQGMRDALGIEAITYDYNRHHLNDECKRSFNTVLIRSSINFCRNLKTFCSELYDVLNKGGIVYVDFVLPTLGACIRWQHEEYNWEHLWNPNAVLMYFERAGFKLIGEKRVDPLHTLSGLVCGFPYRNWKPGLMSSLFHVATRTPYIFRGLLMAKAINRSLYQKGICYFFRKT